MRKLAGIITPCQSNAAATRFIRSPPAAKNVATISTATKARTAKGSRSASRGIGVPALSVLAARSRRQPKPKAKPRERQEQADDGCDGRQGRPQPFPENRPARPAEGPREQM